LVEICWENINTDLLYFTIPCTVAYNSAGTRSKCTAELLHNEMGMQEVAV
jgi:hypothetical protein